MNDAWRKFFRILLWPGRSGPTDGYIDYDTCAPKIVETSTSTTADGPPLGPPILKDGAKVGWANRDPDADERK